MFTGPDSDFLTWIMMESKDSHMLVKVKQEIDTEDDMSQDWGALNTTAGTVYSVFNGWLSNQELGMVALWMARTGRLKLNNPFNSTCLLGD